MPEQPDNLEPTEADIDMVTEEATGKPIVSENLAAGITSMRQRIERLEGEKAKLLNQLDTVTEGSEVALTEHLAKIDRDMAAAREQLVYYESQMGRQN